MSDRPPESCRECTIGQVSGEGQGSFCPFISRSYRAGATLYRQGEQADYVWYVKSGAVSLDPADRHDGERDRPSARTDLDSQLERKESGSFVGLETLVRARYDATASVAEDAVLCGAPRAGFAQWLGPGCERTCTILRDLLRSPGD